MIIDPLYLYSLIFANLFLTFLLMVLIRTQGGLFKELVGLKRKKQDHQLALEKKQNEILFKAKAEAIKIVKEAKIDQAKLGQWLDKQLKKITVTVLDRYQESLEENLTKSIKSLKKISKDVEKESLKAVQAEVANYRKVRLEKAQEEIEAILARVASEVLGRSLSLKDHEKLIFQALDKAQKKGVFK